MNYTSGTAGTNLSGKLREIPSSGHSHGQSSDKSNQEQLAQDLASSAGDERNWRGIAIALLVIAAVCALIVTAVILLTPSDKGPRAKHPRLGLKEVIGGSFQVKIFNGTWISGNEYVYQDVFGSVLLYNVETNKCIVLMPNISFYRHSIEGYSLSQDRKYLLVKQEMKKIYRYTSSAIYQIYNISNDRLSPLLPQKPATRFQYAEWGTRDTQLVYVYEENIFYLPNVYQRFMPTPLSHTGMSGAISNGVPDWVYEEEIFASNNAIWWSSDGTKLCYATFNDTEVGIMTYPWYGSYKDSSNLYPELVQVRYPKPNTRNPTVRLYVVDLKSGNFVPQIVHPPRDYRDIDYYITTVQWLSSNRLIVTWLQRFQNSSVITVCQGSKGWTCEKKLWVDKYKTGWIDVNKKLLFSPDKQHFFLHLPKAEGWLGRFKHVAMIDLENGSKQFLTEGPYDVTQLLVYNEVQRAVYYVSTLENRPGERHIFSVTDPTLDNPKNITCLTCDSETFCLYNNAIFSPGGKYFILECLGPGIPRLELRITDDNRLIHVIEDNSLVRELIEKRSLPQIRSFQVPLPDGYKANVRLFLPPTLRDDEITKYPMVVNVYGGPGSQMVTEKFKIHWGSYLASKKNYIYAWIDGRGSGNRGEKILHEIYRRLGSVEVEDQIAVTRYMKSALPFVDGDRVAVWGWSYGGYVSAMALAMDEDAFNCGVSIAPVTNWLHYDSVFSERYMHMPDPKDNFMGYEKADLMKKAANIRGKKFLLIHGTADDNVHIQQSMMLVKALTDAGVIFRTQIYPDENHSLYHVTFHLHWTMEDFLEQCFASDIDEEIGFLKPKAIKSER